MKIGGMARLRELWAGLLREHASPDRIAAGFALGLFVRFLPLPFLHTVVAFLLAYLFRVNRMASLVGVEAYLPLIAVVPLLYFSEFYLGSRLLGLDFPFTLHPHRTDLVRLVVEGWDAIQALLAGAAAIGLPSAIVSFFVVRRLVRAWQSQQTGVDGPDNGDGHRLEP